MPDISRSKDRAIQTLLGVSEPCGMCDLHTVEIHRLRETVKDREHRIILLVLWSRKREMLLRTYKLAAWAGLVGTVLMAWLGVKHG